MLVNADLSSNAQVLSPRDIASTSTIGGISLSSNGSRVVYHLQEAYRSSKHAVASIWAANTAVEESTKQVTFGDFYDHDPQLLNKSVHTIFFLSDRQGRGRCSQVYRTSITEDMTAAGRPSAITPADLLVSKFVLSPSGRYMAFTASKESNEGDAPEIWGETEEPSHIFLLDLSKSDGQYRKIVSTEKHIYSFAWSCDSSKIIYRLTNLPVGDGLGLPSSENVVSIHEEEDIHTTIFTHPHPPHSDLVWTENGDLLFQQGFVSSRFSSASALWRFDPSSSSSSAQRVAFGETEDMSRVAKIKESTNIAVEIATGLHTRIEVLDSSSFNGFTILRTEEDGLKESRWEIAADKSGRYTFVALRSSAIHGEPEELWAGTTTDGITGRLTIKLSAHQHRAAEKRWPVTKVFQWKGSDGVALDGVISYPADSNGKRLPTIIVPHGGPYTRETLELNLSTFYKWHIILASHGFLVLCPNYRGSKGRGDEFAGAAHGGMGTIDWDDIETMLAEAIAQNLVDSLRVSIGGHSQGGFLTAWGCTRPNNTFRAGVMVAGVSDQGSLVITSDMPDDEADLAGGAPWDPGNMEFLKGSPIREAKNVQAPLLIMHGKKDERVPVTQAIGFIRGIIRQSAHADHTKLVLYPNETHMFLYQKNVEDLLHRMITHFKSHLKVA